MGELSVFRVRRREDPHHPHGVVSAAPGTRKGHKGRRSLLAAALLALGLVVATTAPIPNAQAATGKGRQPGPVNLAWWGQSNGGPDGSEASLDPLRIARFCSEVEDGSPQGAQVVLGTLIGYFARMLDPLSRSDHVRSPQSGSSCGGISSANMP
ncbi:hypothetical protein GCM10022226_00880 [Sphaerisporangium flaviroseum]|uniref:Uncharacterized protein n=1 Tax=Sphaerisporangium flaviroseum TaxID=509199 RepID=A0ABP7HAB5_9ACTN